MDFLRLPGAIRRSIITHKPLQSFFRSLTSYQPAVSKPLDIPASTPASSPSDTPSLANQDSNLLRLSPETLNSYTTSYPPNPRQLKYAHTFFAAQDPPLLYSAAFFRDLPPSQHPEVAFLGRSNVGKSSLLNALFGRTTQRAAHVSKQPGRTRTMNGYGVRGALPLGAAPKEGERDALWKRFPRGGVVVLDMPGYGAGSKEVWGREALKYLETRRQLRCTFVLVDAEHGLKASDVEILTHLRRKGIAHQVVLSKVDKLLFKGSKPPSELTLSNSLVKLDGVRARVRIRLDDETSEGRKSTGDILCCSAAKAIGNKHKRVGIDEIRWAVLRACGIEVDETGEKRKFSMGDVKILEDDD